MLLKKHLQDVSKCWHGDKVTIYVYTTIYDVHSIKGKKVQMCFSLFQVTLSPKYHCKADNPHLTVIHESLVDR